MADSLADGFPPIIFRVLEAYKKGGRRCRTDVDNRWGYRLSARCLEQRCGQSSGLGVPFLIYQEQIESTNFAFEAITLDGPIYEEPLVRHPKAKDIFQVNVFAMILSHKSRKSIYKYLHMLSCRDWAT